MQTYAGELANFSRFAERISPDRGAKQRAEFARPRLRASLFTARESRVEE